jgi:hypothetical protein
MNQIDNWSYQSQMDGLIVPGCIIITVAMTSALKWLIKHTYVFMFDICSSVITEFLIHDVLPGL